MSSPSNRLQHILSKNRAFLGLSSTPKLNLSPSSTSSDSQEQLAELLENLSLSSEDNSILEYTVRPIDNTKMETLRFHSSLLPTFSGEQSHLESFIISINEFFSLYDSQNADQNKLVLAAIKSKFSDKARDFLLSRPDLTSWPLIKDALRIKFGDPITYQILLQQLQYIKIYRNENILQFVDRLKTFVQRIIAKIQCEVNDNSAKIALLSQVEKTSVLILTANSPQTLKTLLMLQQPNTLDDAYNHVLNYNMIESQVNFTNTNSILHRNQFGTPPNRNNHQFSQNSAFRSSNQTHHLNPHLAPMSFPADQKFSSQPVPIQHRPTQRHNAQTFGKPKNVFAPTHKTISDPPVPMSVSTAGPSRMSYQSQPPPQRQNNFQLTNVETYPDCNNPEPYFVDQPPDFDETTNCLPPEFAYHTQDLEEQNYEATPTAQNFSGHGLQSSINLNNIAQKIELPYFHLPKKQITILIDSGASDSIISPKIANLYPNNIFFEPFEVTACKKVYKENQNLKINLLEELGIKESFDMRILNWHNDFDALIGTKDLKKLQALINYENKTLTLKNIKIPFSLAYNKPLLRPVKNFNVNSLTIPVNLENGIAILPSLNIKDHIIPDCLVEVKNGFCRIPNPTPNIEVNFHQRMKVVPEDQFDVIDPSRSDLKTIDPEKLLRFDHLTPLEKSKIIPLCHEFKDILYHENCDLSFTSQTKHCIRTKSDRPIYVKSFRHPPAMNSEIQAQIQKLLDNKIIRPSISPYSAPVWIVPKKPDASGKKRFRLVIDYRRLNEDTLNELWPLPRVEEIMDNLGKCTYFTTIDLAQGFHQIEMDPNSIEKNGFYRE